eukprot:6213615-Pleurochrysis_carterae.AAC.1
MSRLIVQSVTGRRLRNKFLSLLLLTPRGLPSYKNAYVASSAARCNNDTASLPFHTQCGLRPRLVCCTQTPRVSEASEEFDVARRAGWLQWARRSGQGEGGGV